MKIMKVEEKREGVGGVNQQIQKYFPYNKWRRFQYEIAEICHEALKQKSHVVLEAPTGLGKTSAILSSTLPIVIDEELKIIWCCRTHQQVITVLNEVSKIKQKNETLKPIGLWGRKQLCLLNEISNLPENVFRHACSMLRKSFRCPYYRIEEQWIIEAIKDVVYPNEAKKRFESYQFCP